MLTVVEHLQAYRPNISQRVGWVVRAHVSRKTPARVAVEW